MLNGGAIMTRVSFCDESNRARLNRELEKISLLLLRQWGASRKGNHEVCARNSGTFWEHMIHMTQIETLANRSAHFGLRPQRCGTVFSAGLILFESVSICVKCSESFQKSNANLVSLFSWCLDSLNDVFGIFRFACMKRVWRQRSRSLPEASALCCTSAYLQLRARMCFFLIDW